MIVVTVGTQLPFDRLIRMIDAIAPQVHDKIFAQTGVSKYEPENFDWSPNVPAGKFDAMLRDASLIVAHAGIGTVLKAYKYTKPIILVPRLAANNEHRNDHQLATISQLENRPGIYAARTQEELLRLMSSPLDPAMPAPSVIESREKLRSFVRQAILSR